MKKLHRAPLFGASIIALATLLAACGGGGGGGGGTTPPVGGGTPTPPNATPTPTPVATATPTPGTSGTLSIAGNPLANATVVFTCGCNGDGGKISTDANGNYQIGYTAPSVLGNGTYSPSGHNLMVVGYASTGTQAWTMQFLGNSPATNLNLGSSNSDLAATAASLYIYYAASQLASSDKTFDWFNFNQIATFAQHLRGSSLTSAEAKLLTDITSEQAAGHTLYPGFAPTWDPNKSTASNATIAADVRAVYQGGMSADATLPTPCPAANACTGAPTP
ncbi:MAG TPA: hypothetical protein VFN49_12165 [Candidatus Aquilonibacter sp.]|nr:hypothetical protein [Candidatus Aquilonibacter sp.]